MTLKIEGGRDGEQSTVRLIGSGRSELVREIAHQLEPCSQGAPIIRFEVQRAALAPGHRGRRAQPPRRGTE